MSDEIYGEILYDGAEHVSLLGYPSIRDRLILLDGWSKTYAMTGWRLGYGVWPEGAVPLRPSGSRSTAIPASTPRPSSPGSRRSKARASRSTAWSRPSPSGAR